MWGAEDAKHLVQEVHPPFTEENLINLPRYSMYLKLMIDGATSKAFSAETIPLRQEKYNLKERIIEFSNKRYGREREVLARQVVVSNDSPKSTLFEL